MNPPVTVFDMAIIGGGIAGAGIARDAALRGMSVILFEKNTFGSGTSSKSSKLIHGGIRYLEIAWLAVKRLRLFEAWKNFRFVFLSLKETHTLEKIAPGLVKPISLVIPIYHKQGRRAVTVYAGTFLYSVLARMAGGRKTPRFLWTRNHVLRLIPSLNSEGLTGGVILWDHTTHDRHLVEETIRSAVQHGAQAFERAKVNDYRYDRDHECYEVTVEMKGRPEIYRSRKLINASGPWVDKIRAQAGERTEDFIVPVAGSHITVKKFIRHSAILQAEDNRIFFVINIGDTARVGTTERIHEDPDHLVTTEEEVEYLLRSLKKYFPQMPVGKADILGRDSGIRPLANPGKASSPTFISREHEVRVGPTGVLHVLGVKLTDHRRAAEEIVDSLVSEISRWHPEIHRKSLTGNRTLF